jgi:DNA-directed RNA polymerase specialized sigma24 family protein
VVSDRRTLEEFDAAYPRLVAVAHRAAREFFRYDPSKVDDAVGETMARTFARWETVRRHESPLGWVVVCAKDVCLEHLRTDAHEGELPATIWQCLRQVPKRQRSVAVLRFLMGFDKTATVRALGRSFESVETATRAAGEPLRPILVDLYGGDR